MARDTISVQYPEMDDSQSIANVKISEKTVTAANGIAIEEVFANKNNSLVICVENTLSSSASEVTFVAGDNYPNAQLGNLTVALLASSVNFFQIQDPSRFENKDGSLYLDFDSDFTGKVFALAKPIAIG